MLGDPFSCTNWHFRKGTHFTYNLTKNFVNIPRILITFAVPIPNMDKHFILWPSRKIATMHDKFSLFYGNIGFWTIFMRIWIMNNRDIIINTANINCTLKFDFSKLIGIGLSFLWFRFWGFRHQISNLDTDAQCLQYKRFNIHIIQKYSKYPMWKLL